MTPAVRPERSPADTTLWRRLWEAWKAIARRVGDVQARIILAVFYFVVLAPFALLVRLTSDPLALTSRSRRGWPKRVEPPGTDLERARRQF
jgi:lipopolysaccharide/colanic/teichoic acid biosynthesis glycosyltransferase